LIKAVTKAELGLYRQLHRRSTRQAHGLWLVEGPNAVLAALQAGLQPLHVLASDRFHTGVEPIDSHLKTVQQSNCLVIVEEPDLARLATTTSPPPVVGIFQACVPAGVPSPQVGQHWLGLVGLQDPGNVGTLIRCVRAFGGVGVLCTPDTVDCYSPKVIRATAGEVFFTPVWQQTNITAVWPDTMPVWATRMTMATPYKQVNWQTGGLLLLGQEGPGLAAQFVPPHAQWVCVPQAPQVDSLNVAVCGGILMSQWLP
jgi:RNA methyltransferase, TrmH family